MTDSQSTINFVGTRCTDGNHLALQRWYADHVHLLLAARELQQAQLYRCQQSLHGQPPDYFCIYEFASYDDFLKFEHGQPKAQATELTNAAAGRNSVEIVQRSQYVRWLHRQWPEPDHHPGQAWRLAVCLQSESDWWLEAQRWLADQLQALRSCTPLLRAQCFVQHGQPMQALIAVDFAHSDASEAWQLLAPLLQRPAIYGAPQTTHIQWVSSALAVQAWLR